jgi:hypothetical protein
MNHYYLSPEEQPNEEIINPDRPEKPKEKE